MMGLVGNDGYAWVVMAAHGSIALFLAHRCRQVVGIEEIPAAIEDAKVNARLLVESITA